MVHRIEERTDGPDIIVFQNRGTIPAVMDKKSDAIAPLRPDTYHEARLQAPGWDVRELEKTSRDWQAMSDNEPPRRPDAAFIGFCRKWYSRKGRP